MKNQAIVLYGKYPDGSGVVILRVYTGPNSENQASKDKEVMEKTYPSMDLYIESCDLMEL